MTVLTLLPLSAALAAVALALGSVLRKTPSLATWSFAGGMLVLGADSLFTAFALIASDTPSAVSWLTRAMVAKSFIPVCWLSFTLTYSRGAAHEFLRRWRLVLLLVALLPAAGWIAAPFGMFSLVDLGAGTPWVRFGVFGESLNAILLLMSVLILTNIEQTFRAAVGTTRWRIKFVLIGLAVIFGARIYVRAQALLFSAPDLALAGLEPASLLVGSACFLVAYVRTGWTEIDVYPSLAILRSSVTIVIVGSYLFVVGVVAQLLRRFGGAEFQQLQVTVVFFGLIGLVVLLLSDRFRQGIQYWTVRNFRRAEHDSLRVWSALSEQLTKVPDRVALSSAAVKSIAETFDAMSVTLWATEDGGQQLTRIASTGPSDRNLGDAVARASVEQSAELALRRDPFDLDALNTEWARQFLDANPMAFAHGGHRWCVPLTARDHVLGVLILADRVRGMPYTVEEVELLKCIGNQIASVMANLGMSAEVARAREFEAFRSVSAFFVHDLKNAAASLNLMLKNLPVHFDDPEFRADALRGIGNTARRIDEMIARFSALRQAPALNRTKTDLNDLIDKTLAGLGGPSALEVSRALQPLPPILADQDQVRTVVTNLVMNARDAVGEGGRIQVRTECHDGRVALFVEDNGCGMSPAFVKESLFRPFQSTKTKGLGIGLFQSRRIIEAHGGQVLVETEPGRGTTFRVTFPLNAGRS